MPLDTSVKFEYHTRPLPVIVFDVLKSYHFPFWFFDKIVILVVRPPLSLTSMCRFTFHINAKILNTKIVVFKSEQATVYTASLFHAHYRWEEKMEKWAILKYIPKKIRLLLVKEVYFRGNSRKEWTFTFNDFSLINSWWSLYIFHWKIIMSITVLGKTSSHSWRSS